jgi:transposase
MTTGFLTMSKRELDRAEWMREIRARRATQAQVAERLGVSVRQVERLYRAYKADGAEGLISKKRGRPSPRRLPDATRAEVLTLVRERYGDFGPTLAQEKLTELHGVKVSVETLRQWMTTDGLWEPRAGRAARVHPPRRRRACLGELIQIDGCDHEWFESRAPRCVLLVYVDDATSRLMHMRFVPSESTFDYFESTRQYIEEHGKPVAFYSDKAGVFRVNAKAPRGGDRMTQFTRALEELNVDLICASSPQAKGRVERAHQTLQDRLVKELRLHGISTVEGANQFVTGFIADYNSRFAQSPSSAHDAHRPLRAHEKLDEVFRWKESRVLSMNLTIHYNRYIYLVESSPEALKLRGKEVEVHETFDGRVLLRIDGLDLRTVPFNPEGGVRQQDIDDNKYLATTLAKIRQDQLARDEEKLTRLKTLREKRKLEASLDARR